MSHDISIRSNGFSEMAFTGATPWHGLGQRVTEGATIEDWKVQSGLDWVAEQAPVMYQTVNGVRTAVDKFVVYRGDTGAHLGVVGDQYKIVQPGDALEFYRDLAESGGWHVHTAGALGGGRKVWALARNGLEGEVSDGDKVRGNLLFATSLDGSMRTIVCMTAVRVVCANTLRLALADKAGKRVSVSHRSVFDADAVKQSMGVAVDSFERFMADARRLAETPIAQAEAREILRELFGRPARVQSEAVATYSGTVDGSEFAQLLSRPAASINAPAEEREHRNVAKVMSLFNGDGRGSHHAGSAGTRWGLLNAVTEFVDHQSGRSQETRLNSAWFGQGADLKDRALAALTS